MSIIKLRSQPASTPRVLYPLQVLDRNIRQPLLDGFWTCVHQLKDLDLVITLPCWCSLKTDSRAAHQCSILVKYSHSLSLSIIYIIHVCVLIICFDMCVHTTMHGWWIDLQLYSTATEPQDCLRGRFCEVPQKASSSINVAEAKLVKPERAKFEPKVLTGWRELTVRICSEIFERHDSCGINVRKNWKLENLCNLPKLHMFQTCCTLQVVHMCPFYPNFKLYYVKTYQEWRSKLLEHMLVLLRFVWPIGAVCVCTQLFLRKIAELRGQW